VITPLPETEKIECALHLHGIKPRRMTLISPLGKAKGRRWSYRVEAEDGRIVKARQFENSRDAGLIFELRAGLEDAFAPALGWYEAVLIEEWVEGIALSQSDWGKWAEKAGALLGRLHSKLPETGTPSVIATALWLDRAHSDLLLLHSAGKLDGEEVAVLREELRRRDPARARATLIHMDFCADNMLVDRNLCLRIIDNEQLKIGPQALDLGRTFNLWPMPYESRVRFRQGYDSTSAAPPEAIGFWRIIAALGCARVFLNLNPARCTASIAQIRRFLKGEDLSDP
jgi:Ser/Thr protein kinase RdoA (MazF antagonist)